MHLLRKAIFHVFLVSLLFFISCAEDNPVEVEETIQKGQITAELIVNGVNRSYILYVPQSYTGEEALPLVLNFHGLGSNAFEQMVYGDFRGLAEEENFIIAHPTGTVYQGFTHWNVGGFTTGSPADDIGFSDALIAEISSNYSIDANRVYATGMSNGGYMSFLLACQLNDKIAAIASVTGTMTPDMVQACAPTRPMPVMQIHGTADATVSYEGFEVWNRSIPDVIDYWVSANNCNLEPSVTRLFDLNPNDENFIDHFVYSGGDNGSIVEHYKINNGTHSWPGTAVGVANRDINASQLVWEFFKKYDLNGALN
jgi:polyhydroxybutyrate depolymerase